MTTFSSEQLNFFKFATVVFDEFPPALRRVFVHLWDTRVAPTPSFQPWDDSPLVRKMFLAKEGGKTKHVPTDESYKEWDCTALFEATLYAKSFPLPVPGRKGGTLADLYVKPRRLPSGAFHPSVTSPTSNHDETFALALDQLRLLRNTVCHKSSSEIDKITFDLYIKLSKDAFVALKQSFTKVDDIGKLAEKDFPTERVQQLEHELRRETLRMIASEVTDVKKEVDDVGSDMKDVKTEVTDTRTKMESVELDVKDMKARVADVRITIGNVETDVKEVKTMVANGTTKAGTMELSVGSEVKDVKAGVEDAKTSVEAVRINVLEVKTKVTDIKTTVTDVESDVKEVKNVVKDVETKFEAVLSAGVEAIKQTAETARSIGHVAPPSCMPDKIPHFYGRQKECDAILGQLMGDGNTRVVDIWGSPGFGKTSVAINIAHHLREKEIPVYFISLRGMKSKDEIVSRLLSIFDDAKHVPRISLSDWLIQSLKQLQNPFVLILDNADDLLESGDTTVKDEVLKFAKDILAQCCNVKLLFTTRESLDFWNHEVRIHLERVRVLDEISSAKLVKSLLPDVSVNECTRILKECGQVPLAMRLMCSIMREENVSLDEVLEELKTSTLVEVLDNERFPHDSRLKSLINTSFQRLSYSERVAFVCLAVFPGNFEIEEAGEVLGETATRNSKILRALEAKSLIESHNGFRSFTIHSLLRSFIHEKKSCDPVTKTTFHSAQLRFYNYNIKNFETANENFFTGRSNDAVETFVSRRENIIESLVNGTKEDDLFTKTTQVLSKAELFLFSVLHDEESTFNRLYDTAVEVAKKRKDCDIRNKLLAAKYFGSLGWFYMHEQYAICPLQHISIDAADCPPKLLCYFGIHELLSGKLHEGISLLERFVVFPSNGYDENVFTILAFHVLAVCYRKQEDDVKASHFETTCSVKSDRECASLSPAFRSLFLRDTPSSRKSKLPCPESVAKRDAFFFSLTAELLPSLYRALGKQIEIELSVFTTSLLRIQRVLLALFKEGQVNVRVLETCCIGLDSLSCYKEAAEGFEMIASQLENALGNHEDLARNYHSLGLAQKELKEYDAAHCSFKRALEMRTRLLREKQETAHDREVINDTIESLTWYAKVLENANASFPDKDIVMAACEKLEGLVAEVKEQHFAKHCFSRLGRILNNFSTVFYTRKDYNGALVLIHRSIRINEESLGDVVETVSSLCNEGHIYLKMGRYMEGENSVHRALDLCERLRINDNGDLAFQYSLIAEVFLELGKDSEALKAQLLGLQIRKEHLGKHHLTAASFHEIGCTFYKMGMYEQAVKQLEKAVELRKLLLGGNHTETALSFKCLYEAQYSLGHVREAVATLQLLVCIYEALDDDENTAWCYDMIGYLRREMGDMSGALNAVQKALRVRSERSSNLPDTASTIHHLGVIFHIMNDFKSALENFQKAVFMRGDLLGEHEDTASSYHCLGVTQISIGDHNSALSSLTKALEMRTRLLGDHIDTASTLHNLGVNYRQMGENRLAFAILEKVTCMRTLLLGDHEDTASSYYFLGAVQMKIGDLNGALESLQKSLQLRQNLLGDHLVTFQSFTALADVYFALGDMSSA